MKKSFSILLLGFLIFSAGCRAERDVSSAGSGPEPSSAASPADSAASSAEKSLFSSDSSRLSSASVSGTKSHSATKPESLQSKTPTGGGVDLKKYVRNVQPLTPDAYKKQMNAFKLSDPVNLKTYSESEKEAQRKAASKMRVALNVAVSRGEHHFKAEPGVYRFAGTALFDLTGAEDLYIDISGCTFILEGNTQFLRMQSCRNVILQGKAVIDREGGFSTQFTVSAYDEAAKRLTVRLHPGYSLCDMGRDGGNFQWFREDGSMIQACFITYTRAAYADEAEGIVRFEGVAMNRTMADDRVLKAGQIGSVVSNGWSRVLYLNNCKDIAIYDLYNYGSGCLFLVTGHNGDLILKRVYNVRMPGTNRLIAGSCGQLAFEKGTPVLEDCIFGFCEDDSLDIMGHCGFLYRRENDQTVLIKGASTAQAVRAGDTLRFYAAEDIRFKGEAKAVKVEVVFDPQLNNDVWRDLTANYNFFSTLSTAPCVRVTLDRKISADKGDMVENMDSCRPFNAVIRNCYFHDMGCRVLVQGCKGLLFENNLIERSGLSALCLDAEQRDWGEGPNTYDAVIRNNVIRESNSSPYATHFVFLHSGAISVGPSQYWRDGFVPSKATDAFRNIRIENNKIYDSNFSGILVKNTSGVVIRNNQIYNPVTKLAGPRSAAGEPLNDTPGVYGYGEEADYAVYLYACEKITLSGNTVQNAGKHCKGEVRKHSCK